MKGKLKISIKGFQKLDFESEILLKTCSHSTIIHFKLILKWASLPIIVKKISDIMIEKRRLTFRFPKYSLSQEPGRAFLRLIAGKCRH